MFDVLVLDSHVVIDVEVTGERRQAQGREQGVLDRS
jgi:hypothetical protein